LLPGRSVRKSSSSPSNASSSSSFLIAIFFIFILAAVAVARLGVPRIPGEFGADAVTSLRDALAFIVFAFTGVDLALPRPSFGALPAMTLECLRTNVSFSFFTSPRSIVQRLHARAIGKSHRRRGTLDCNHDGDSIDRCSCRSPTARCRSRLASPRYGCENFLAIHHARLGVRAYVASSSSRTSRARLCRHTSPSTAARCRKTKRAGKPIGVDKMDGIHSEALRYTIYRYMRPHISRCTRSIS